MSDSIADITEYEVHLMILSELLDEETCKSKKSK